MPTSIPFGRAIAGLFDLPDGLDTHLVVVSPMNPGLGLCLRLLVRDWVTGLEPGDDQMFAADMDPDGFTEVTGVPERAPGVDGPVDRWVDHSIGGPLHAAHDLLKDRTGPDLDGRAEGFAPLLIVLDQINELSAADESLLLDLLDDGPARSIHLVFSVPALDEPHVSRALRARIEACAHVRDRLPGVFYLTDSGTVTGPHLLRSIEPHWIGPQKLPASLDFPWPAPSLAALTGEYDERQPSEGTVPGHPPTAG